QGLELGPVAQRRDDADHPVADARLALIDDQYAVADQVGLVARRPLRGEECAQRALGDAVAEQPSLGLGREAEQAARPGAREQEAALAVDDEDASPNRGPDGLVVLAERG